MNNQRLELKISESDGNTNESPERRALSNDKNGLEQINEETSSVRQKMMSLGYNSRRNPQSNFIPKIKSKSREREDNSDILILQTKDSRKQTHCENKSQRNNKVNSGRDKVALTNKQVFVKSCQVEK